MFIRFYWITDLTDIKIENLVNFVRGLYLLNLVYNESGQNNVFVEFVYVANEAVPVILCSPVCPLLNRDAPLIIFTIVVTFETFHDPIFWLNAMAV